MYDYSGPEIILGYRGAEYMETPPPFQWHSNSQADNSSASLSSAANQSLSR